MLPQFGAVLARAQWIGAHSLLRGSGQLGEDVVTPQHFQRRWVPQGGVVTILRSLRGEASPLSNAARAEHSE